MKKDTLVNKKNNLNILMINWRSIKDSLAGGAEVSTFEHTKRWIKNKNASVVWFTPSPLIQEGVKSKVKVDTFEEIPTTVNSIYCEDSSEGVGFKYFSKPLPRNNLIKLAFNFSIFYLSVFFKNAFFYKKKFDIIIDQVHGLFNMSVLYSKNKTVIFIHEVGLDIWEEMYPKPIVLIGKFLFKIFAFFNKDVAIVTVSNSVKKELTRVGFKEEKIEVIENGVSIKYLDKPILKEEKTTLVFFNRLVKMKRPDVAIKVFAEYYKNNNNSQLWIMSSGEKDYIDYLHNLAKELGVFEKITFWGYISEKQKEDLLAKAHIFLNTSVSEGWGLTNLEANARGTPCVAFDVPGNRDSIKNGVNGYTSPDLDILGMVNNINKIKKDYDTFSNNSISYAKKYSWDSQAEKFYNVLEKEFEKNKKN